MRPKDRINVAAFVALVAASAVVGVVSQSSAGFCITAVVLLVIFCGYRIIR